MLWGFLSGRLRCLVLLLLAFALAPAVAVAQPRDDSAQAGHCHAPGAPDGDLTGESVPAAAWICDDSEPPLGPERTYLRFDIGESHRAPAWFATRRMQVGAVHVSTIDADGSSTSASFPNDQLRPALLGGYVMVPLPEVTPTTRQVVVAFDQPTHGAMLTSGYISPHAPGDDPATLRELLLLAALCGLLATPLIFNFAFYRILRENFVLWHTVMIFAMMLMTMVDSGLSTFIVDATAVELSRASSLSVGMSVAAAGMFTYYFIEADRINPAIRRLLPWAALWCVAISSFHAYLPFVARPWQSDLYYAAYLPVLLLYVTAIGDALFRGSRAARFQAVGWTPIVIVAFLRIIGQLTPLLDHTDASILLNIGCALEVVATSLGVADRFMLIKRQRDRAQTEARMLGDLSERDTLTGLHNRRMVEERFPALRDQGFTTMAVLDLDHFKAVNDTFGHAVGDEVLRAVATALQPDEDTIAVRLGGEEFMLLLRGRNPIERAEHRRGAIVRHVAAATTIDRPVTASMGVVVAPLNSLANAAFEKVYLRADRLLYEAKAAGRNRMLTERLQVFHPRGKDDRAVA